MTRKEKREIVDELRAHINERAEELGGGSLTKESMDGAIAAMGRPEDIAAGFRGDGAVRVELKTRAFLTLNLAWGISLIAVSILFFSAFRYTGFKVLGVLGVLLGVLSSSLCILQVARPGTIPSLRIYVLFPACGGATALFLMLFISATYGLGFDLSDSPLSVGQAYTLIVLVLFLNLVWVRICYRDSMRYPFLFRGIGFVVDGYMQRMSKGLKPLDSVTKFSLLGEMKSHVEEQSARMQELPKKERDRRLEETLGDSSITARRLVENHERKASRRLRIMLRAFLVVGAVSLGFGLLLISGFAHALTSPHHYLTLGMLVSSSVLVTLAALLVFFVMKQMTYNTKTRDYLLTSTVLFVVVTLILSFAIASFVTGGLHPAYVPYEPLHTTGAVVQTEQGGYDVLWTEKETLSSSYQRDSFLHYSTLDENGIRTRDRDLGPTSRRHFPNEFVKIADTYYFPGGRLGIVDTDEGSVSSVLLPLPQTDEWIDLLDVGISGNDDHIGVGRMMEVGGVGAFHYESVLPSGEIETNWTHEFSRPYLIGGRVAVTEDSIFLLWNENRRPNGHREVLLRYEFLSTDGLVTGGGTLHYANVTLSDSLIWLNHTTVTIVGILQHGPIIHVLWSYEIEENGEYEHSMVLSSIRDSGGEVVNNTLHVNQRPSLERGYVGAIPFTFPFWRATSERAVVSYFYCGKNIVNSSVDYSICDRSISGVYVLGFHGNGTVSFHTRVHWPTDEHTYAFPVSVIAQNDTHVFWIDLAEWVPSPAYSSVPVHMVRLSEAGEIMESKVVISDPRVSFMMYWTHNSGQGPFAAGDGKFDFVSVGGRQRSTLTEQIFGASTETPWSSQVLHARLDFSDERWSFHGISEEFVMPDLVSDLLLTAVLPALGVGICQWLFMYTRVWWSRRKGTA